MSDILQHLFARRSIRRFASDPVSPDDIEKLLQAAMAAPSASNRKPWEFVVVTEREVLRGLRRVLVFGRYEAPLSIVVCGNLRLAYPGFAREFWIQDCSAATQNLLLAASGLGLGAVWIGVYPIKPFIAAVSRAVGLPSHVVPLCVVDVGHPAQQKEPRTQYDIRRVYWQQYEPPKARRRANEANPEGTRGATS